MTQGSHVRESISSNSIKRRFRLHPARAVLLGFVVVIIVGTILLTLPIASSTGEWTGPVTALFTATSAVCVTGLAVVDTGTYWSSFGQVVILVLIQLGGLGIMIFASLIGLVLARKISARSRINMTTAAKVVGFQDLRGLVRGIILTSLVIEGLVFILLASRFILAYDYDLGEALWQSIFHTVSSFNNAGFSLFQDSLMGFVGDPFICLPIAFAAILGGLGFPVLYQLRKEFKTPLHWSMNTKCVLWVTGVLLVGGAIFVIALEWGNPDTLGAFDPATRVLAGFFQSTQTRSAGFNSLDIGSMQVETLLGMDVLMFIGGGPGGTAGGIKVTTVAVLFFIMLTELRGEGAVNIFGKRLSRSIHRQAITLLVMAMSLVFFATIVLMLITDEGLDATLFETVSALGNVGLSTGITGSLPPAADLVLVVLMIAGRLGPLTLGTAIALKERKALYEYPKERPFIG